MPPPTQTIEAMVIQSLPGIATTFKRHRRFLPSTSLSFNPPLSFKEMRRCHHAHWNAATQPNPLTPQASLSVRQSRLEELEPRSGQPKVEVMNDNMLE
jgi:hypothetical protein